MRTKENEMLVSFDDIEEKYRWDACLEALREEYTISFKDMCKVLMCSRSWAMKYLKPHLHYIYISNGAGKGPNFVFAASKALGRSMKETTWYSRSEFENLINDCIGTVTRQTILVPIELLITDEKLDFFKKHYIPLKKIKKKLDEDGDYESFKKSVEARDALIIKCASEQGLKMWGDRPSAFSRTATNVVDCNEIHQIDIYHLLAVHDVKDYGDADEEIYRQLFNKGVYRLNLQIPDGNGVTSEKIYYFEDKDEFNYVQTMEKVLVKYEYYVR